MVDYSRIDNTLGKMGLYLSTHESICVGVSGGSDSNVIVHIIATRFRQFLPKIHFVFNNTGIEYQATLRHLDYMEKRYGIHIDRIKPALGDDVVSVCKREGFPILSKNFSYIVYGTQQGWKSCISKFEGNYKPKGRLSSFNFKGKQKELADYIVQNNIKVSSKCCDLAKKKPYKKYLKEVKADLTISGERQCEGGLRVAAHKGCYESQKSIDKYMPLWFWDDETKAYYKEHEGIVYSDCYEIWGKKRTG